jgi:hypothetical protein
MHENVRMLLIVWFAFLAGVFFGLWWAHSLSAWEGWFGIGLNVVIIWILHRMASNIRRFNAPKS